MVNRYSGKILDTDDIMSHLVDISNQSVKSTIGKFLGRTAVAGLHQDTLTGQSWIFLC